MRTSQPFVGFLPLCDVTVKHLVRSIKADRHSRFLDSSPNRIEVRRCGRTGCPVAIRYWSRDQEDAPLAVRTRRSERWRRQRCTSEPLGQGRARDPLPRPRCSRRLPGGQTHSRHHLARQRTQRTNRAQRPISTPTYRSQTRSPKAPERAPWETYVRGTSSSRRGTSSVHLLGPDPPVRSSRRSLCTRYYRCRLPSWTLSLHEVLVGKQGTAVMAVCLEGAGSG